MNEYLGYTVSRIDGRDNTVEFRNGVKIEVGQVLGDTQDSDQIRRIQIRETIESHLERERQLFYKGIKVLSLFFIDEVAKYTRDQALAAVGYWNYEKRPEMREGVLYLKDKKTHLFFINLNKSEKDFSPTTMYEDYAINEILFHWQSQSTTTIQSKTGQSYINHDKNGENIILFVREQKSDKNGAMPYTCLGKAHFVSNHGEKPMNIVWRLEKEMPAWLYKLASQAIAV